MGHISRLKTAFKTSFSALSKLAVQVKIHIFICNKKVEEYNVGSIQFQIKRQEISLLKIIFI